MWITVQIRDLIVINVSIKSYSGLAYFDLTLIRLGLTHTHILESFL